MGLFFSFVCVFDVLFVFFYGSLGGLSDLPRVVLHASVVAINFSSSQVWSRGASQALKRHGDRRVRLGCGDHIMPFLDSGPLGLRLGRAWVLFLLGFCCLILRFSLVPWAWCLTCIESSTRECGDHIVFYGSQVRVVGGWVGPGKFFVFLVPAHGPL